MKICEDICEHVSMKKIPMGNKGNIVSKYLKITKNNMQMGNGQ